MPSTTINITFSCPHCEQSDRVDLSPTAGSFTCHHCRAELKIPPDAFDGDELLRCLACPSKDLFVRKDFPQRLGVTIVVLGFALSCLAWAYHRVYLTFGILFATFLIDALLYLIIGNALNCYRCGAQYRRVAGLNKHRAFDLATHERYRQQAARLAQQGAAGNRNA